MATEIEIKLILGSLGDHARVAAALTALAVAPVRRIDQVNYYLDTMDRALHAQQAMARLRVADGAVQLTVKVRPQLLDGVMRVTELEAALPDDMAGPWRIAPPSKTDLRIDSQGWLQDAALLKHPLPPTAVLHCLGAMRNTRQVFTVPRTVWDAGPGDVHVELDRVHFGAGADQAERFEIEVEIPDAPVLLPRLQAWLDGLGVDHQPAAESKYAQFLRLSQS